MTVTCRGAPPGVCRARVTVCPGGRDWMAATNALASSITRLSTPTTTSPATMPAVWAGDPGCTSAIAAPRGWASATPTPMTAWVAWPVSTSSVARRRAWLIGIANPRPIEPASWPVPPVTLAIAVLTPITRPWSSTSGPPELPGLIAASVWIASRTLLWPEPEPPACTGRWSALMMPVVTVPESPSGEPTAMTVWPCASSSELPRLAARRLVTPLARTTAMSAAGAVPTIWTGAARPSEKIASSPPPWPACRTWLLVMIRPSAESTTPEPSPAAPRICTALGSTFAATASIDPGSASVGPSFGTGSSSAVPCEELDEPPIPPIATADRAPPMRPATSARATSASVPGRRRGGVGPPPPGAPPPLQPPPGSRGCPPGGVAGPAPVAPQP